MIILGKTLYVGDADFLDQMVNSLELSYFLFNVATWIHQRRFKFKNEWNQILSVNSLDEYSPWADTTKTISQLDRIASLIVVIYIHNIHRYMIINFVSFDEWIDVTCSLMRVRWSCNMLNILWFQYLCDVNLYSCDFVCLMHFFTG